VKVWATDPPASLPLYLPVTADMGWPLIEMPGCVEAREEWNEKALEDDPEGNLLLCTDVGMPSFQTLDYNQEGMVFVQKKAPDLPNTGVGGDQDNSKENNENGDTNQDTSAFSTDNFTGDIPKNIEPKEKPCPRPDDPSVGSKGKFGRGRVKGYERNEEGECITLWEEVAVLETVNTYLPPPPLILSTGAIAATAVTSSVLIKPLSDYLLKIIKPLVKKVLKKVLPKLMGKKPKVLSVRERRLSQRDLRK
tara:strand:+ start:13028 stop:13777 length:750 start_codon:yes stop_codon:yes gene_type:complete